MTGPVKMNPATAYDGAVSCHRIALDSRAVARQIKGCQIPAQAPPGAVSEMHDAMNQLMRSAIAVEAQRGFLFQSARAFLEADAGHGGRSPIHIPELQSPWPKPKQPDKKLLDRLGIFGDALKAAQGAIEEAAEMVIGLANLSVALTALATKYLDPDLAKRIPGLSKKADQFEKGLKWAYDNPEDFLLMLGKDTISYDLWKKHEYARAIGHNVVGFATLFIGVSKLGKAGAATVKGMRGERAAAKAFEIKSATAQALEGRSVRLRSPGTVGDSIAARRASFDAKWAAEQKETARMKTLAAHHDAGQAVNAIKAELADKAKKLVVGAPLKFGNLQVPPEKP